MFEQQFKKIILNLQELRKLGLEFDDNALLDSATKIYNTEIINQQKTSFKNTNAGQNHKPLSPTSKGGFVPATKKQIEFLARNNIDHNAETITKKEAWKIIEEFKNEKRK